MFPFTASYPERTARDVAGKTFDYIIVGGGTAGCLVASRLSSDPSVSVLVLEKGFVNAGLLSRVPLLGPLQSGVINRYSEPNPHLRDRRVRMMAAEMLGGTSRINSMVWTHGRHQEYDSWARDFGLDEWAWERVEQAFRRIEDSGDWGVKTKQADHTGFMPYVDAVMARVGLSEEVGGQGYFRSDVAIDEYGKRSSALTAWLDTATANARKEHLTICTGVVATKLEFEDSGSRVSGVRIRSVGGGTGSDDILVKAHREVIVCSGVIGTPQLLMLSGIGPEDQLSEKSITVMHNLSAVGKNLATHTTVPVMTKLLRKQTLHVMETINILWHFLLYVMLGTGIFAMNGQFGAAWVHSAALDDKTLVVKPLLDSKEVPDIEILITPVSTLFEHGIPGVPCMTWNAALVQPYSTGKIELTSTDPEAQPKITIPLLADERDRVRMRKAVRFAMRLADEFSAPETKYPQSAPLALAPGMDLDYLDVVLDKSKSKSEKKKVKRLFPAEKDGWRTVSDAEIDEYVNRLVTGSYDPISTCRMSLSKEDGVVDQKLRVHGVRNLRLADASVFPKSGSASISSAVYMIGERCAEFVKKEWD